MLERRARLSHARRDDASVVEVVAEVAPWRVADAALVYIEHDETALRESPRQKVIGVSLDRSGAVDHDDGRAPLARAVTRQVQRSDARCSIDSDALCAPRIGRELAPRGGEGGAGERDDDPCSRESSRSRGCSL